MKRLAVVLVALLGAACSSAGGGDCPTESGTGCAPKSARVDLYEPTFSDPTTVTNPLFPIAMLDSVVFSGTVDGKPFRTETTLLPETKTLEWNGREIEALVSQYMAFSGGRIEEVALDYYAQDDIGAVWYLGEDVADYDKEGVIFTHEGTWRVGVDGAPLSMIMPSVPHVGDAYLAENTPPSAWEELTVLSVDLVVSGPSGPIPGAMVGSELHMDGEREEKVFAPGYGEFSTGSIETDNLEALALAIPADALSGGVPAELETLAAGTADLFDAAEAGDWSRARTTLDTVKSSWESYRAGGVPPLLEAEMDRILDALAKNVARLNPQQARHHTIALTRVIFDFFLRYETRTDIDRVRLDLWLAQVIVDAGTGIPGPVRGDAATLELVWNRVAHTFDAPTSARIEADLSELRRAARVENFEQAIETATRLRATFAEIGWRGTDGSD